MIKLCLFIIKSNKTVIQHVIVNLLVGNITPNCNICNKMKPVYLCFIWCIPANILHNYNVVTTTRHSDNIVGTWCVSWTFPKIRGFPFFMILIGASKPYQLDSP